MSDSVLNRIDDYFSMVGHGKVTSKENALQIVDLIIREDREYGLMLRMLRENIEAHYDHSNELVKRHFISVMEFYDVLPSKLPFDRRRTIVEEIGGEEIKSKYSLKSMETIKKLL